MNCKISASILFLSLCATSAMGQGTGVSLSGGEHDLTQAVEILSESLSVDETTGVATFTGGAKIKQGNLRIGADRISVEYAQAGNEITNVNASGNVIFSNGSDNAEAQRANYNVTTGILSMSGDVLLLQGRNAISGNKLDLDVIRNTARVTGNVKTVLVPN